MGYAAGLKLTALLERLHTSRSDSEAADVPSKRRVGDGTGRPLYQFNTIELPSENESNCIALRLDKATHAISVDAGGKDANSIAWGCYDDSISTTGWSALEVSTAGADSGIPLAVRAYAAGVTEGLLTAKRLNEFHSNVRGLLRRDAPSQASLGAVEHVVRMSLVAWEEFSGGDVSREPEDDLQKQAWAALLQLRGLRDGNNLVTSSKDGILALSLYQVLVANMHAELPAIVELYSRSEQAKVYETMMPVHTDLRQNITNKTKFARWAAHQPHGAAIIRRVGPLGSPEDLLAGHVAFGDYSEMTRITKTYNLAFGTQVNNMTMSSYPGCIGSTDDYIMTGKGLVAMSTSLWIPSDGVYSRPSTTNEGLPSFLRAVLASRLASKPRTWAKIYGLVPGIAGAKQWLLADYGNFKPQIPIANDTLWLLESLPRLQRAGDVTNILREGGYFEAHGVPHFGAIRQIYGLPAEGPAKYEEFQQSALLDKGSTISTIDNAREVLTDTSSSKNGQIPIGVRSDLDSTNPVPAGSIDAKVAGSCLVGRLSLQAKSGPPIPAGGDASQAFAWVNEKGEDTFPGWPRMGLPDKPNFAWVNALPGKIGGSCACSSCASLVSTLSGSPSSSTTATPS
eukprot:TRINITY_DN6434_c0_g3_i1.p1 TRINITY_DN6434_c0_g3~~TRINITY_DN6434_c0_g3_i1.p1  ORF type:complete len:674 (+),score=64.74 TRINITY_DN6434_c0_g3_i1:152-2023(+)